MKKQLLYFAERIVLRLWDHGIPSQIHFSNHSNSIYVQSVNFTVRLSDHYNNKGYRYKYNLIGKKALTDKNLERLINRVK